MRLGGTLLTRLKMMNLHHTSKRHGLVVWLDGGSDELLQNFLQQCGTSWNDATLLDQLVQQTPWRRFITFSARWLLVNIHRTTTSEISSTTQNTKK